MKGIVIERKKRFDIVMTAEGGFYKTKIDTVHTIGEEVQFTPLNNQAGLWSTLRSYLLSPQLKAAAAILICLAIIYPLLTWTNSSSETYAYVNIDINPSFTLEVNNSYQILNVQGLNDDGTELLSELDNLEGESLQEVSTSIVTKSRDMGYLDGDRNILLGVSYASNQSNDQDNYLETLSDELSTAFDNNYEISWFEVPDEIRKQAEEAGTSMNILFASDQIMNQTSDKASNEERPESDQEKQSNNGDHLDEDVSDESEEDASSSDNQGSQSNQSLNDKLQQFLEGLDDDDLPSELRDKLEDFKSDNGDQSSKESRNNNNQSKDEQSVFGDKGTPGHRDDDDSEEDQDDDNEDDHPVFGDDGPPGHSNNEDSEEDRNHNQDDQDKHQGQREDDDKKENRNKKDRKSEQSDDHPVFGDDGPLSDNEDKDESEKDDESSDDRKRESDEKESGDEDDEDEDEDDDHPVFGDDGPPGQSEEED